MGKIEELKQLMSIEGCNTAPDIKRHFDHIAKLLFECFVIEYEGSLYLFNDIEFYYYNKLLCLQRETAHYGLIRRK